MSYLLSPCQDSYDIGVYLSVRVSVRGAFCTRYLFAYALKFLFDSDDILVYTKFMKSLCLHFPCNPCDRYPMWSKFPSELNAVERHGGGGVRSTSAVRPV